MNHESLLWGKFEGIVSAPTKEIAEHVYVQKVMCPLLGSEHVDAGVRYSSRKFWSENCPFPLSCIISCPWFYLLKNLISVFSNNISVLIMFAIFFVQHMYVSTCTEFTIQVFFLCCKKILLVDVFLLL